ncbi:MAG TPA: methyltransferase domain-containing protein [bacterium]|nr:methyltransferase domain-containing protein [bacterium]
MDRHLKVNQSTWDTWARYHLRGPFYDVEGFKAGRRRDRAGLDALEVRLLGDVTGRSLLHLQCHFGLDTLAWARRGAKVTGVDFSGEAIAAARALAEEVAPDAAFVESDLYDLPGRLQGEFDIVFTSHGVLGWLPDLGRWAEIIARFLRPRGRFCIVEAHPFALTFDDARSDRELRPGYPYFHRREPMRVERDGSYAAPDAPIRSVTYQWVHSMSDIIGSLLRAGLRIDTFEEYPFMGWAMLPWMEARSDGCWELPPGSGDIPLMFSLTASKDVR